MSTFRIILGLIFLCLVDPAQSEPIPLGAGEQRIKLGSIDTIVFTYNPATCRAPLLLLVFHGNGGVPSYREHTRKLADKNCMIVIAPRFDKERFPSELYQRGGIAAGRVLRPERDWTVNLVTDLVNWARSETGISDYYLIGHSAGAQFLSRVAAFLKTDAKRIVIANPSTYVMPSLVVRAPYGLGGVYDDAAAAREMLHRYLAQPVTIYLGEDDTGEEDEDLSQTRQAIEQGKNRYERGINAFNAGRRIALKEGVQFGWRLVEVPGIGHSAGKMFAAPQAIEALKP